MTVDDLKNMTFREQIIAGIAGLKAGQEAQIARLDKLNGSIVLLFERMNSLEKDFLVHPQKCDIKDKVDELDRELSTGEHQGSLDMRRRIEALEICAKRGEAAHETNVTWYENLKPVIGIILGAIIMLLLNHVDIILDAMK